MRSPNLEPFLSQFFIDTVSGYGSDFALFPEFFTAPLMADFNHLSEAEAIRELAQHTEAVKLKFQSLLFLTISISSQAACLLEDEHVYNVVFLCKRDGTKNVS
jgi:predicted amidohydrolase